MAYILKMYKMCNRNAEYKTIKLIHIIYHPSKSMHFSIQNQLYYSNFSFYSILLFFSTKNNIYSHSANILMEFE